MSPASHQMGDRENMTVRLLSESQSLANYIFISRLSDSLFERNKGDLQNLMLRSVPLGTPVEIRPPIWCDKMMRCYEEISSIRLGTKRSMLVTRQMQDTVVLVMSLSQT